MIVIVYSYTSHNKLSATYGHCAEKYKQRNPLVILTKANLFQSFNHNFLRHRSAMPGHGHGPECSVYVLMALSKARFQRNLYPPEPNQT